MKWVQVDRARAQCPRSGTYDKWKHIVRAHCAEQCVYCAIPESRFGGLRNFHVEHYRPKGNKRFRLLINKIDNLLYACSVCNSFKGDDWPSDPAVDHSCASYPDPVSTDYNLIFTIGKTYRLRSRYVAGCYVRERLALDRWQLLMERREAALLNRLDGVKTMVRAFIEATLAGKVPDAARPLSSMMFSALQDISDVRERLRDVAPYGEGDVKRPKKKKR